LNTPKQASSSLDEALKPALDDRRARNRYRQRRQLDSAQHKYVNVADKQLLNFCSNDYLGLANHPEMVETLQRASALYGVGSGASHLVCGHSEEHHLLEQELAVFTGRDRALLFSTGYMANVGVINALVNKQDLVLEDKLNHASLLDGGLSSGAQFKRYAHNNMEQLKSRLSYSDARRKLIVTDGVFSMDGDKAPLQEIANLAKQYDAYLMVDDAHGFGCLGERGGGLAEELALTQSDVPVLMGTLGKGFGCFGAFIAGSETLIESLIQFSRTYIYTTALPPAIAAATRCSLRLVQEDHWRREHLQVLIQYFRSQCELQGLALMPSASPIQPLVIGRDDHALALSEALFSDGFWVSAIRPPTVPEGTARLRFTLCATHSFEEIDSLVISLVKHYRRIVVSASGCISDDVSGNASSEGLLDR
jgi:8-amino-7-oxononanoate synthase